jgi:hypothetical protein
VWRDLLFSHRVAKLQTYGDLTDPQGPVDDAVRHCKIQSTNRGVELIAIYATDPEAFGASMGSPDRMSVGAVAGACRAFQRKQREGRLRRAPETASR